MITNLRVFALISAFVFTAYPAANSAVAGDAKIKVENPVKDFGKVSPHEVFNFSYKFKNTGSGKLKINRVQSTCGCTVPELNKKEYAPGEEGEIKVRYTSSQREGAVTKHLYIHSNDESNPRYQLKIKSNTVLKISVNPKRLELSLVEDNAGFDFIKVHSKDDKAFKITGIKCRNSAFKFNYSKDAAKKHMITADVDSKVLEDSLNGLISIQTDHPECGVVSTTFQTLPLYSASPARIIVQDATPGQVTNREVWIKSNYGNSVEIAEADSKNGYMSCEKKQARDSMTKLMVKIEAPEEKGGSRYFTDELKLKINGEHTLDVKCSGWFRR
ncbi:hypothetical protein L21SP3_00484 [Sedimentisphaera cyanobacteriorum]|uniref:DUF1573 domain-containing protein n=1 Tax=Sedimentisphaera cyanobacteriorum TaxID=1940790 RepID=A0A1Q2HN61_9BACT|nr:DUF1573 domain-containing protein [Sedimentisphaera cyanobacteriorum]AQQ08695.1 hypothetical protein L21SP3_00484 [Sedimentisphaera cyanobacteriorum]